MRIGAKRLLDFSPAFRARAWLAAVLLVLHWSIPALTLPQLTLDSNGPLEFSAEERDGQPAANSRLGGSSQGAQLRTDFGKRETIHTGGKTNAILAEAFAEFSVEPFSVLVRQPVSRTPLAPRRAFDARGPPLHGV
jgi:hypothetical protein